VRFKETLGVSADSAFVEEETTTDRGVRESFCHEREDPVPS
jgi:hypothetical protein